MKNKIITTEDENDLKILRTVSSNVENIEAEKELITKLKEELNKDESSLAFSAPQFGENKTIFVMVDPNNRKKMTVCINPEIIKLYPNKIGLYRETCLSEPNLKATISRYKMLKVRYTDESGKVVKKLLRGVEAVMFQHEMDHLFGILMSDKNIIKERINEV
jgi:peptide deformylase